jgi:hypothetical protein
MVWRSPIFSLAFSRSLSDGDRGVFVEIRCAEAWTHQVDHHITLLNWDQVGKDATRQGQDEFGIPVTRDRVSKFELGSFI